MTRKHGRSVVWVQEEEEEEGGGGGGGGGGGEEEEEEEEEEVVVVVVVVVVAVEEEEEEEGGGGLAVSSEGAHSGFLWETMERAIPCRGAEDRKGAGTNSGKSGHMSPRR